MLNNGRLLDWSSLSHKAQNLEYNGKQKTLEPLRFQGFEHSEKDQRLLNWGARRAAFKPCAFFRKKPEPVATQGFWERIALFNLN